MGVLSDTEWGSMSATCLCDKVGIGLPGAAHVHSHWHMHGCWRVACSILFVRPARAAACKADRLRERECCTVIQCKLH